MSNACPLQIRSVTLHSSVANLNGEITILSPSLTSGHSHPCVQCQQDLSIQRVWCHSHFYNTSLFERRPLGLLSHQYLHLGALITVPNTLKWVESGVGYIIAMLRAHHFVRNARDKCHWNGAKLGSSWKGSTRNKESAANRHLLISSVTRPGPRLL